MHSEPYQTSKKEFFRGVGRAAGSTSGLRLFDFCPCQSSKGFLAKYYAVIAQFTKVKSWAADKTLLLNTH